MYLSLGKNLNVLGQIDRASLYLWAETQFVLRNAVFLNEKLRIWRMSRKFVVSTRYYHHRHIITVSFFSY